MKSILKIWPKWVQSGSHVRMSHMHIHPNLIKMYFQIHVHLVSNYCYMNY